MRVLVTGANGYLGQGVVKQLLDDDQDVLAVDFAADHIDPRAPSWLYYFWNVE